MNLRISYTRSLLACIVIAGCRSGTGNACDFVYLDPLVSIVEVTDAVTDEPIASVRLQSLHWNGHDIADARFFTEVGAPTHGVTALGGDLVCEVACGFANQEGLYNFTVHHDGYRDTTVSINATYRKVERTCPIRGSGGVILQLQLSPL